MNAFDRENMNGNADGGANSGNRGQTGAHARADGRGADAAGPLTALRLNVNNHPGVMSHVCALFSGRAFNLEGIVVAPAGDGATCRMWLLVNEDERMEQVIKQVRKLRDVLDISAEKVERGVFARLASCIEES